MHKITILFLLICWFSGTNAQEILVPYEKDNKFGLINEKGKVRLNPQFNRINWVKGKYFMSFQKAQLNDLLIIDSNTAIKRNDSVSLTGLIYEDKELIKPSIYQDYFILPEMLILASFQGKPEEVSINQEQYDKIKDKPAHAVIYSYKGDLITSEPYRKIEYINIAGKSNRKNVSGKYVLLLFENFDKTYGLAVLDTDEGKIKEWLIQNAKRFFIKPELNEKYYGLEYISENGVNQNKMLIVKDNYFEIADSNSENFKQNQISKQRESNDNIFIIPDAGEKAGKNQEKTNYKLKNGILSFNYAQNNSKEIPIEADESLIFEYEKNPVQSRSLIYKKASKFGIISEGNKMTAEYEELTYFGNDYILACKNEDSKLKCGTINQKGEIIIPLKYDSIQGKMPVYTFRNNSSLTLGKEKQPSRMTGASQYRFLNANSPVIVFQNGKSGILNLKNESIAPVIFDEIGENGIEIPFADVRTKYIVTKRDGLYGVILNEFDSKTDSPVYITIEPVFSDFPAYYFSDYYDKKGFKLFALFSRNKRFSVFASENGKVFRD